MLHEFFSKFPGFDNHEFTDAEVARVRLLGAILHKPKNDEPVFGVHDANLVFREYRNAGISKREIQGLISAGLTYFDAQNAPLWKWLQKVSMGPQQTVADNTLFGSNKKRINAFKVLTLFFQQFPVAGNNDLKSRNVKNWLSQKNGDLVVASLNYLESCGVRSDIEEIEPLTKSSEMAISKAACSAKIAILARHSVVSALEIISEQDDIEIFETVSDMIFASPETLRSDLLLGCLSNQSIHFRRKVASELLKRGELSEKNGELLINSEDAYTRMLGVKAIELKVGSCSDSHARERIVKPKKPTGMLSLLQEHFDEYEVEDVMGEAAFECYKHSKLCNLSRSILKEDRKREKFPTYAVTLALYDRYFPEFRTELVQNLGDGFKAFLNTDLDSEKTSVVANKRRIESVRLHLVRQTVDILAKKDYQQGLTAIRKAVDQGEIEYSRNVVRFLSKRGSFKDVDRVHRICKIFPSRGKSIFAIHRKEVEYNFAATAILKLGSDRVTDVIEVPMETEMFTAIIQVMSIKLFTKFDHLQLLKWLRNENEGIRKTVALKCVICLPKKRIDNLLQLYTSQEYHYNVVFWLDLGVSFDRESAIQFAIQNIGPKLVKARNLP